MQQLVTRVDLGDGKQSVRELLQGLAPLHAPVELVLDGRIVGKLVPPNYVTHAEVEQILDTGWAVVEKARARTKGIPASVIQKEVDKAVREVRARSGQRRR